MSLGVVGALFAGPADLGAQRAERCPSCAPLSGSTPAPGGRRAPHVVVRDGAIGFVNFATRAWEAYAQKHDLEIEPPEPRTDPGG
jgi:hypothetical protein